MHVSVTSVSTLAGFVPAFELTDSPGITASVIYDVTTYSLNCTLTHCRVFRAIDSGVRRYPKLISAPCNCDALVVISCYYLAILESPATTFAHGNSDSIRFAWLVRCKTFPCRLSIEHHGSPRVGPYRRRWWGWGIVRLVARHPRRIWWYAPTSARIDTCNALRRGFETAKRKCGECNQQDDGSNSHDALGALWGIDSAVLV